MAHGHRQCSIGALLGGQPLVGEFGNLGIIRGDRNCLGALVTYFGKEVGVRGTRLRHVRAPSDNVAGIVPVSGLRYIGLFAPGHWRGRRQVTIPVVEAHADAANQRQVAATRGVANHRHGGNRRKANDPVGAVLLGGVNVRGSDQLVKLVPVTAYEAAHAASTLVLFGLGGVFNNRRPGVDRVWVSLERFPP